MTTTFKVELHPTVAALDAASKATARGARPQLMVAADDAVALYFKNAGLSSLSSGFGPGGEAGIYEEAIAVFLANVFKVAEGTTTADGSTPKLLLHAINAEALTRVGRRLAADGFDFTEAPKTSGDALLAVRAFAENNALDHADYLIEGAEFYTLGEPTASAGGHWMYTLTWEGACSLEGRALWASVALSYIQGWALPAGRHNRGGTVLPILDALWTNAEAAGPASRAGATGVARADSVSTKSEVFVTET